MKLSNEKKEENRSRCGEASDETTACFFEKVKHHFLLVGFFRGFFGVVAIPKGFGRQPL